MNILDRWTTFQDQVETLCDDLGREPPLIVAVSKKHPIEAIQEAYDAGIRHFGENYIQELESKASEFPNVVWHYIGSMQSRHISSITSIASYIHSLDRIKIANILEKENYNGKLLVQVNISKEQSKSGLDFNRDAVNDFLMSVSKLDLDIIGLMGMGDFDWSENENFEAFSNLVDLASKLGFSQTSIGMSGDWKEAVRAGSTIIRIGTAIFGPRK